jgi:hypothetical protein
VSDRRVQDAPRGQSRTVSQQGSSEPDR